MKPETEKLYKGLIGEIADARESAIDETKELLVQQYGLFEGMIFNSLADGKISEGLQKVLMEVVEEGNATYGNKRLREFIADNELLNNAEYLFDLIPMSNANDKDLIFSALKRITGKDAGNDIDAWREIIFKR